jgi:alpha-amylase
MYFSRGNPVICYSDEQGFTGSGGDQVARQTMFASQVPEYLDDDLLGTDSTHADANFNPDHPLYHRIRELAALTKAHPALRDGAQQDRYSVNRNGRSFRRRRWPLSCRPKAPECSARSKYE